MVRGDTYHPAAEPCAVTGDVPRRIETANAGDAGSDFACASNHGKRIRRGRWLRVWSAAVALTVLLYIVSWAAPIIGEVWVSSKDASWLLVIVCGGRIEACLHLGTNPPHQRDAAKQWPDMARAQIPKGADAVWKQWDTSLLVARMFVAGQFQRESADLDFEHIRGPWNGTSQFYRFRIPIWLLVVVVAGSGGLVALVRSTRRNARRSSGCCIECGYDLTGNVSGVCPECGAAAPDTATGAVPDDVDGVVPPS